MGWACFHNVDSANSVGCGNKFINREVFKLLLHKKGKYTLFSVNTYLDSPLMDGIDSYTISELKEILKQRGLSVSARVKQELVDRLREAEFQDEVFATSDNSDNSNKKITTGRVLEALMTRQMPTSTRGY